MRAEPGEQVFVAEPVRVEAEVRLGEIASEHVQVELYHGVLDKKGEFTGRHTKPMVIDDDLGDGWHLYRGEIAADEAGKFGFTVRILPRHELLANPHSLGLIHWAEC